MNARQQVARLLPLAVLVLLAAIGARAGIARPRWDGPLRADGAVIGVVVEVILAALLVITVYRDRAARREAQQRLIAGTRGPSGDEDERDVAAALRVVLQVLLAVAMVAVAVAALEHVHMHVHVHVHVSGPAHSPSVAAQPAMRPSPPAPRAGQPFRLPLTPVLYAALVVALLVVGAASIWWARRLRQAALPGALRASDEEDSGELREAVASGRAAMAELDDARAAIIACYAAMERSLAARGAARGAAGTPDELLRRAIGNQVVRGDGARRLTTLFYEARFSTHELGPDSRDAAIAALDELATELGDVAVPRDAPGLGTGS
jgi:hypothetical protein